MSQVNLILGGARSGKSSFAERYIASLNMPVTYIATAQALDGEMTKRIAHHKSQRPSTWALVEAPTGLAEAINLVIHQARKADHKGVAILVDCLTLWLSNCLCQYGLRQWQEEKSALLNVLKELPRAIDVRIVLVSNEVGHGIIPMGELSREFVDQSGWLHQEIASIANHVEFVMAGLPLTLKSPDPVK